MVHLNIMPLSEDVRTMYESHKSYHEGDSGLDLFVVADQTVKAGDTELIKLGIKAAAIPKCPDQKVPGDSKSVSWLLMPRSSIYKTPLRLCNSIGLIDAGFRGEVMAAVDNIKTTDYTVKKGDRLVQAVAFDGAGMSFALVESLDETARGEGGFGSTSNTDGENKRLKCNTQEAVPESKSEGLKA